MKGRRLLGRASESASCPSGASLGPGWLPCAVPVLALALAGCGGDSGDGGTPPEPSVPATITLQPTSANLTYIGQTAGFNATVRDQYGTAMAQAVSWASSDDAVFTVDTQGQVTAAGNGSATLEATVAGLSATATVNVEQRAAAIRIVSGNGQTGLRNMPLPEPVVVRLEDRGGHGVADQSIQFAPSAESGSVTAESVTSDENGEGSTEWTLGSKFGAQSVVVSVPGGIQNRVNATATSETPLPDLAVTGFELSRDDPTDLETFDLRVAIANQGDAASPETFRLQVTVDGVEVAGEDVSQLGVEASAAFNFTLGPLESGARRLAVVVDPDGGIDEWEKSNNREQETLEVAHQEVIDASHTQSISATLDEILLFRIDVGTGSSDALNIEVSGGQGDPDLFVHYGSRPDHHYKYGCISGEQPGTAELCQFRPARTGVYHVAVHAYSAFGPVDLKVSVGGLPVESFDIELIFLQNGSPQQDEVIRTAARKWESVISQGVYDLDLTENPIAAGTCGEGSPAIAGQVDDVVMFVSIDSIDGPGRVLARAGPCGQRLRAFQFEGYPTIWKGVIAGGMEFDEDDMARLGASGTLLSTVTHEMGHALGFGTMWELMDLIEDPTVNTGNPTADVHFTGPLARAAFDRLGGRNYRGGAVVPLESGGNLGRSDSHWRESVFENELMTPFLSGGVEPFSLITIEAMADIGYNVDPTVAESFQITNTGGTAAATDHLIDLGNDIARYPIVVYDPKGRRVGTLRPR